jgi:hypothetical protein
LSEQDPLDRNECRDHDGGNEKSRLSPIARECMGKPLEQHKDDGEADEKQAPPVLSAR